MDDFFNTPFDIAFNCLHGKWGEDGILQGYCQAKGIPFTGPGLKATIAGYDKPMFKHVLHGLGIPTPQRFNSPDTFPLIAKPKSDGSSIGIHLIKSNDEFLKLSSENPTIQSTEYFYEEYINGKEITSGVITIDGDVVVLPILEIESKNDFYDLEAKYTPEKQHLFYRQMLHKLLNQKLLKFPNKFILILNVRAAYVLT